MEFKGTKGEWNHSDGERVFSSIIDVVDGTNFFTVATVCQINSIPEEMAANALLISKAPELLEKLHSLAMLCLQSDSYDIYDSLKREVDESLALIKSATELPQ